VANLGRVIAFGIEEAGHLQDVTGAVGHAQLAALAAVEDEVDFAVRYHNAVLVEGFTPKFHGNCLLGGVPTRTLAPIFLWSYSEKCITQ
jgi:hypothetical protein